MDPNQPSQIPTRHYVYMIECLATGRRYIGTSGNPRRRFLADVSSSMLDGHLDGCRLTRLRTRPSVTTSSMRSSERLTHAPTPGQLRGDTSHSTTQPAPLDTMSSQVTRPPPGTGGGCTGGGLLEPDLQPCSVVLPCIHGSRLHQTSTSQHSLAASTLHAFPLTC